MIKNQFKILAISIFKYEIHKRTRQKALEYAYILEDMLPSPYYKKQLAKLLYLHDEKDKAIIKLREIIPLIENVKEKEEIEYLIERYKT